MGSEYSPNLLLQSLYTPAFQLLKNDHLNSVCISALQSLHLFITSFINRPVGLHVNSAVSEAANRGSSSAE